MQLISAMHFCKLAEISTGFCSGGTFVSNFKIYVMKTTTHYILIMDESSSMSNVKQETLTSLNEQIENCRKIAREMGEEAISLSLSFFNTHVRKVFVRQNPARVGLLTSVDYKPGGYTALLDAVGMSIQETEAKVLPNDDVVMLVLTDGQENASQFFTFRQIAQQIERLKATGKWTFSFMGADIDAWDLASRLSISNDEVISLKKENIGEEMKNVQSYMSSYMAEKFKGELKTGLFNKK